MKKDKEFDFIQCNNIIENFILKNSDKDVVYSYFKLIIMITMQDSEINIEQNKYIKRILCGCDIKENCSYFFEHISDINKDTIEEILKKFGYLKYNFCIDTIIMMLLGDCEEKQYEFLAGIMEILEIRTEVFEKLVSISESLVKNDLEKFIEIMLENFDKIDAYVYYPYIQCMKEDIIVNNKEYFYFYNYNNKELDFSLYTTSFINKRKILIENGNFILKQSVLFENVQEVMLKNCQLNGQGGDYNLTLNNVNKVLIENSTIYNFAYRCIVSSKVSEFVLDNNVFLGCGYSYALENNENDIIEGVILIRDIEGDVKIVQNDIVNCWYINKSPNIKFHGIFMTILGKQVKNLIVNQNQFIECRIDDLLPDSDAKLIYSDVKPECQEILENVIINKLQNNIDIY